MPTFCAKCGHTLLPPETGTVDYPCGLEGVQLIGVRIQRCSACDNPSYRVPQMSELHRLLALAVVQLPRPLKGEEIHFLRKYLGKTSKTLGAMLGVGEVAVSRWENGHTQMRPPTERLLRLIVVINPALEAAQDGFSEPGSVEAANQILNPAPDSSAANTAIGPVHYDDHWRLPRAAS